MVMVMMLAFVLALLPCFFIGWKELAAKRTENIISAKVQRVRRQNGVLWTCMILAFCCAGFWRGTWAAEWCHREQQLNLDKTWQKVEGRVISIREGGEYQILVLEKCVCVFRQKREEGDGKAGEQLERILIYLDFQTGCPRIGNRIQAEGEMLRFSEARNPGEFDYEQYYRSQKLNYRMFADSWRNLDEKYSLAGEFLRWCSNYAGQVLEQIAKPEDAGIFQAAILGKKDQLDREIQKLYQKSGIAHLLAISGLHLSLVSAAAYGVLRRMGAGYGKAGIAGSLLLTAYAVMTGASPSVVRALIMAVCGFLASYLGRSYDLLSALGLSALLLLWDSPYRLCQSGVQLSFGAVAGIGIMAEILAAEDSKNLMIWRVLAASGGMQLVTLPIVLYHFFQFPLYGIFLNLLVVPLMGIVVASGTAGILLGSFSLSMGRFAAGSGHAVLKLYEYLCRLWECLPYSCLILGQPTAWQLMACFGVMGAALCMAKYKWWRRSAILVAASFLILLPLPLKGLEVTFLDVGQGDGICLRTRTKTVLVDGGSTDQKRLGENRLEPFLKSKGISVVDYAVVSHGDQDHISGLLYLLEEGEVPVRHLVLPAAGQGDEVYDRLEKLARKQRGEVLWMKRGDRIFLGKLSICCLYPEKPDSGGAWRPAEDRNEHSLVLRVDYGDFHMLLTGDMSREGEARLMELEHMEAEMELEHMDAEDMDAEDMDAEDMYETGLAATQILKVAHHGSRYSTTKEWLDEIRPVWAVISCGENNRYGHPGEEVLENLAERKVQVFETYKSGAVSVRTDGRQAWWKLWNTKK